MVQQRAEVGRSARAPRVSRRAGDRASQCALRSETCWSRSPYQRKTGHRTSSGVELPVAEGHRRVAQVAVGPAHRLARLLGDVRIGQRLDQGHVERVQARRPSAPPVLRRPGRRGRPGRRTARTPGASARRTRRPTMPPVRRRTPAASGDRSSRGQGGSSAGTSAGAATIADGRDPVGMRRPRTPARTGRPPTCRARRTGRCRAGRRRPRCRPRPRGGRTRRCRRGRSPGRLTATRRTPTRRAASSPGRAASRVSGHPWKNSTAGPVVGAALPEVGAPAVRQPEHHLGARSCGRTAGTGL